MRGWALLLALSLLAVALGGCGGQVQAAAASLPAQPVVSSLPVQGAEAELQDEVHTAAELSADVFAMQMLAENTLFSLPCGEEVLSLAGWYTDVPATEPFGVGQGAWVAYTKNGTTIKAYLANLEATRTELASCRVIGLLADIGSSAAQPPAFAGGLALGMAEEEVRALCGVPDGWEFAVGGIPYAQDGPDFGPLLGAGQEDAFTYTLGKNSALRLRFEDGRLAAVEMENRHAPAALPAEDVLPPEVLAWQAPEGLGTDWTSYVIRYAGDLYSLPVPVYAFMQNGWQLRDEAPVPPGGWMQGVALQKGNQVLRTKVYNFSGTEQPLTGCFVAMVESSKTSMNASLELPGGITNESVLEDFINVYGYPHQFFQNGTAANYTWYGPNGSLVARFRPEDMLLYDLEIEHHALADKVSPEDAAAL